MKFCFVLILLFISGLSHAFETKILKVKNSFLTYLQNHPDEKSSEIEHAIITVTGSERNTSTYLNSMDALTKRLKVNDKTVVIAPSFKIGGDEIAPGEVYYTYEGWWIGDKSLKGDVSSFEVIDELLMLLDDDNNFPHLKTITLTGHSAGGHLVQRFALGSDTDKKLEARIKFVVANPGTYAYLNERRWINNELQIPERPACAYNNYKYGLDKLNSYMSQRSVSEMVESFLQKDVTYFIGEADIGEVEMSCESVFQGKTRYERGVKFKAFLDADFRHHAHELVTVPGIGHTQHGMYNSKEAQGVVFENILE